MCFIDWVSHVCIKINQVSFAKREHNIWRWHFLALTILGFSPHSPMSLIVLDPVLSFFWPERLHVSLLGNSHSGWHQPQAAVNLSVQLSRSVVSDSLRPHESQHARPPCPSPTPGVYSDSRPLSRWYHPAISSTVIPFFSCPQSLPASGSFPMSQLLT